MTSSHPPIGNLTPFISLVSDLSGDLTDVVLSVDQSLRRNKARLSLIPGTGTGGSYFVIPTIAPIIDETSSITSTRRSTADPLAVLKPSDEEAFAINNPKGFGPILDSDVGKDGRRMKHGILPGEGASREAAAYLLDFNHFARVPRTALVIARHQAFHTSQEFKIAAINAATTAAAISSSSGEENGYGKHFAIPISSQDTSLFSNTSSSIYSSSSSSNFSPMLYPQYVGNNTSRSTQSQSAGSSVLSNSTTMPYLALSVTDADDNDMQFISSASTPRPMLTLTDAISMPVKECSLQAYVPHACSAEDVGTSFWPVEDVQAIAMFDIRLCNADRNDDNLLIRVWRSNTEIKTLEGAEDALRVMKQQQQQQQTSLVRQSSFSDRNEKETSSSLLSSGSLQRIASLTKSSSGSGLSQQVPSTGASALAPSVAIGRSAPPIPSLQRISSVNERLASSLTIKVNSNITGENSAPHATKSSTPRSLRDEPEAGSSSSSGNKTPRPDLFSTLAQQQLLHTNPPTVPNSSVELGPSDSAEATQSSSSSSSFISAQNALSTQSSATTASRPGLFISTAGLIRQPPFSMSLPLSDSPYSSSLSSNSFLNNSISPSSSQASTSLPTPTTAASFLPTKTAPESKPWRSTRLDKLKMEAKMNSEDLISVPVSLSPKYDEAKSSPIASSAFMAAAALSSAASTSTGGQIITSPLIRTNSYRTMPQEVRLEIIPVDHGAILPSSNSLDDLQLSWVHWPQVKKPVSPRVAAYIKGLDGRSDALKIHRVFGSKIRPSCLLTLRLCTSLLKLGVENGLTLSEIGRMMLRESGLGRIDPEGQNKSHSNSTTNVSLSPSNSTGGSVSSSKHRAKVNHHLHRYQRSLAVEAAAAVESNTRESRRNHHHHHSSTLSSSSSSSSSFISQNQLQQTSPLHSKMAGDDVHLDLVSSLSNPLSELDIAAQEQAARTRELLSRRAADTERLLPSALEQAVRKAKNVLRKTRNEQAMWNGVLSATQHNNNTSSHNLQLNHNHLAVAMPPLPWNVKNKGDKQRRSNHALAPAVLRPPRKYSNSSNGSQGTAPPPLPGGNEASTLFTSGSKEASSSSKIASSPILMSKTASSASIRKQSSGGGVDEPSSSQKAPPSPLLLSSGGLGGHNDEPEFMALHDGIEQAFNAIILIHIQEVIRSRSGKL
jgi:hypothetical protein